MFKTLMGVWGGLDEKERRFLRAGLQAVLLIGGLSIILLPAVLTRPALINWFDFSQTGQIGDTINGIATPFIALLGVILTFLAFYIQYRANEQQRSQFTLELQGQRDQLATQDKDRRLASFEAKYYELLRLHKANVNEIKIDPETIGRNAFVVLYKELRFTFYLVKFFIDEHPIGTNSIDWGFEPNDDERILRIAYLVFFNGLGDNSDRLWHEQIVPLSNPTFSTNLRIFVLAHQAKAKGTPYRFEFRDKTVFQYLSTHIPFEGHIFRLGHYYRHLFQFVKFVDSNIDLTDEQKGTYIKTIRAQLSSYEQILLYYNTFSKYGAPWVAGERPYLVRYRMVKNMPLPLADFGVKPETRFKEEIDKTKGLADKFFEWDELKNQ